jgi:cell division protein FtsB
VAVVKQDAKRYRWLYVAGGLLVMVALVYLFMPKVKAIREHQRRKAALMAENQALEESIRDRRNKRERFSTDPEFVERTAHEAGLIRSDEVVFKFTNGQGRPVVETPSRP